MSAANRQRICSLTVCAFPPPPCPDCLVQAEVLTINCDDNGTEDPLDDLFYFDVLVTGLNISPLGWRQALPNGVTGLTGHASDGRDHT